MAAAWLLLSLVTLALVNLCVSTTCLNNCSQHGRCDSVKQVCICNAGYAGTDCSIAATLLNPGTTLTGQSVLPRRWNYYYTTDSGTPNVSDDKFVYSVNTLTKGDIDIFVQKDRLPTRTDYMARNITTNANFSVIVSRNFQGIFYIGIYGFRGTSSVAYSISLGKRAECPNNCNDPRGTCKNGRCECRIDYTGDDCSQFVKQMDINKEYSGTVSTSGWAYYRIHAIVENTLRVIVNETCAAGNVDLYIKFGSPPTLTSFDLSEQSLAKNFYLDIQLDRNHFGQWFIGLYGLSSCTFKIHYTQYNDCPNLCSEHGTCSKTGCSCAAGYTGSMCETMSSGLQDGQIVKGFVGDNTWNWYTYTPRSIADMLISLNETAQASQDCDLYVKKGSNPSLTSYDARNISLAPKMTLRISDAQFYTWHIGVFGFRQCTYFLSATSTSSCAKCGPHGTCGKEGICICQPGWAGEYCGIEIKPITNYSQPINASLSTGKWNYYSIQGHPGRYLTVHLLELETVGDFWLFLNPKYPPTLSSYNSTLSDKEGNTNHHTLHTEVTSEDVWYIGVYGSPFSADDKKAYPYELQAWESPF